MDRFQNKYRIASARAAWWDYSWAGAYFITICTAQRQHFFGEIEDGKMQLSNIGVLADVFWHEIRHHSQQLELGSFVVMPNHIHGILILNETHTNDQNATGPIVETRHALSLPQPHTSPGEQRFQNQGKNTVSSIIGSYKAAVTKHAHRLGFDFGWQTRFHDHIVRNDIEYQRINDYIELNPSNRGKDKL
ncbi:transposase [Spirosoma pollinicola]|uniref:Transposase n=1 Tax=Spirosoma pollinicola TaxID=2057025 RepID=A0A2K8YU63_9BACT|nr:transposase [Spirosoma pollinicola]AUD01170.1 transposase [Spirosoma pollinicola]